MKDAYEDSKKRIESLSAIISDLKKKMVGLKAEGKKEKLKFEEPLDGISQAESVTLPIRLPVITKKSSLRKSEVVKDGSGNKITNALSGRSATGPTV